LPYVLVTISTVSSSGSFFTSKSSMSTTRAGMPAFSSALPVRDASSCALPDSVPKRIVIVDIGAALHRANPRGRKAAGGHGGARRAGARAPSARWREPRRRRRRGGGAVAGAARRRHADDGRHREPHADLERSGHRQPS
jgi:hypothetical protein